MNAAALTGAEAADLFRTGEVDVVQRAQFSEDLASALGRLPGVTLRVKPGTIWEHLDIRVKAPGNPALGHKLVRRALAYGIDRVRLGAGALR